MARVWQHPMPGPPHLSHAPRAELFLQAIAPQLARPLDLGAQMVDHAGSDVRHADDEQVREYEAEEELGRIQARGGRAGRDHQPDDDADRADRGQSGRQRTPGGGGHDDGEQDDPDRDPGESQHALVSLQRPGIGELSRGDRVTADDLEDQREVHRRGKRNPLAPDRRRDEHRYRDPQHARSPLHEAPQESGPVAGEQQRREDAGHEEGERVQQGEDAKALGGLAQQIGGETRRDVRGRRAPAVGAHQSDVLLHAGLQSGTSPQGDGDLVRIYPISRRPSME